MSTAVVTNELRLSSIAAPALAAAAGLWFLVAVIGQWAFLYYIVAFYGASTVTGNFQAWTRNTFLVKGYVAGDTEGNLDCVTHVLLAAIIAFGGAIQLIPQIRARAIVIHRWNGRLFVLTALGGSVSGLYMVWVRGARINLLSAVGVSLNAVLIILFAGLAWRTALKRDIPTHRLWALRLYLVANGQWFIRVVFMASIFSRRLVGIGGSFDGPFFLFWGFGSYLLPLVVLELYLLAKESAGPRGRFAMAGGLLALTIFMGVGIFGFSTFMSDILPGP